MNASAATEIHDAKGWTRIATLAILDEEHFNARLIAAAPDLAVALKWMLNDDSGEARAASYLALSRAGYLPVVDAAPAAPKEPHEP